MNKIVSEILNKQFIKYIITGITSNVVFFIIYYAFLFFYDNYKIAYMTGSLFMIAAGYIINKKWVFKHDKNYIKTVIKYFINSIFFILLGIKLTEYLVEKDIFSKYTAVIIVIGASAGLSYISNKIIVFRKQVKK